MAWNRATDGEWNYLMRMFLGLHSARANERGRMIDRSSAELRRLFDEGLPGSPISDEQRIRARTIIRERVREMGNPNQAFLDPYFELEWGRVSREHPELNENMTHYRSILWDAFYARHSEADINRQRAREEWRRLIGRQDRPDEFAYSDT